MINLRIFSISLLLLGLSGCANQPPQVYASIPLLDEKSSLVVASILPKSVSRSLAQAGEGEEVGFQGKSISVMYSYTSALGLECKRVLVSDQNLTSPYKTAACKSDAGWYLSSNLL